MLIDHVQDRFWNSAKKVRRKERRRERWNRYFASWFQWTGCSGGTTGVGCCDCIPVTLADCEGSSPGGTYCIDDADWGSPLVRFVKNSRNGRCYEVNAGGTPVPIGSRTMLYRRDLSPITDCESCTVPCPESGGGCPGLQCFGGCDGVVPSSVTLTFAGVENCPATACPAHSESADSLDDGSGSPRTSTDNWMSCSHTLNGTYTQVAAGDPPQLGTRCGLYKSGDAADVWDVKYKMCDDADVAADCETADCEAGDYDEDDNSRIVMDYNKLANNASFTMDNFTGWQIYAYHSSGGSGNIRSGFYAKRATASDACYTDFTVANEHTKCIPCRFVPYATSSPGNRLQSFANWANLHGPVYNTNGASDPPDITPVPSAGIFLKDGSVSVAWSWA